jgi:8-oxo-dGTP diphosphatase
MEKKQQVIAVAVVKNEEGKFLVARRNEPGDPKAHDKWEFLGGKVEYGEDPEVTVVREVKEESGMEVKVIRLLPKVFTNFWVKNNTSEVQTLLLNYECVIVGGKIHTENFDEKISELKFIDRSEFSGLDVLDKVPEILELLDS